MSPKRMPSQNHWKIASIKIATTMVCRSLSQIKVFGKYIREEMRWRITVSNQCRDLTNHVCDLSDRHT
jgi:hypothetical protein